MFPSGDYDIFSIPVNPKARTFSATFDSHERQPSARVGAIQSGRLAGHQHQRRQHDHAQRHRGINGTYWLMARDRTSGGGGNYSIKYTLSIDNSSPALSNALLTLNGTSKNDKITLTSTTHNGIAAIDVNMNGTDTFYDSAEIERINIMCGAGDDKVTDSTSINTYIFGDVGNDTLQGGSGNDTLTGAGGKNLLMGGDGDDRLNGSGGHDVEFGEGGNDRLYGNGGDDSLDGGGNVDRLFGGDGNDVLVGGSGNDKLMGEAGNDTLSGGKGSDLLDGGDGTDTRGDHDSTDTIVSIEN